MRLVAFARAAERLGVGCAVLMYGITPSVRDVAAFGVVAVALVTVRSLLGGRSELLVRKDLYLAVARSLSDADVMHAVPLPGGDAEGALSDAVHSGTRCLGTVVPFLYGDIGACVLLATFAATVVDWRITAVALGVLALVSGGSFVVSRRLVRVETRHVEALLAIHASLGDLLARREEIAATGTGVEFRADLEARLSDWQRSAFQARITGSLGARAPLWIAVVILAAAVVVSPPLRAMLEGVHGLALLALAVLAPLVLEIARSALELRSTSPAFAVLRAVLSLPPLERGGTQKLEGAPSSFVAQHVGFAYGSQPVVHDVSFTWKPGTTLVFAGPNGSGKSTMLRLLLGFARPSQGDLVVDGTDLFDFDLTSLRRHVAYVPQRPSLPGRRSVRELLAAVEGSDAGSIRALVEVGFGADTAASFLDRTMATLSAGQAQRVALARAFASKRPLLLLDEPDANLDDHSVECLATCLRELRGKRMIAVAAHHPKLLACADSLVTLEGGT